MTFPIRLAAEERSWILYKVTDRATNQLINLYISKINPCYIQFLEEAILQDLAIRGADMILSRGYGNRLSYESADTKEERILASIGELQIAQNLVVSVTFSFNGRTHSRKWVQSIQIMQYQTMISNPEGNSTGPLQPMDYAEVLVTYDQDNEEAKDDVITSALLLKRDTVLSLDESNALVRLASIQTIGTLEDEQIVKLDNADVTVQLTCREVARELHKKLEDMRMELFIRSLQYPRPNEIIALRLQVGRVECESICISDADMTVTTNAEGRHRLIIESRNKCTLVSQVLVEDFFNPASTRRDYSGLTYVVQYQEDGTRKVYKYEHGFRHLNLSGAQAGRMLELAWTTMSTSPQGQRESLGPAEN